MENEKIGFIVKLHGGVKIRRVGNSAAVIIPVMWKRLYATKIGDTYYAKMTSEEGKLIIERLDQKSIKKYLKDNGCQQVDVS